MKNKKILILISISVGLVFTLIYFSGNFWMNGDSVQNQNIDSVQSSSHKSDYTVEQALEIVQKEYYPDGITEDSYFSTSALSKNTFLIEYKNQLEGGIPSTINAYIVQKNTIIDKFYDEKTGQFNNDFNEYVKKYRK